MDNLNWTSEPYHRRTPEEATKRKRMVNAWISVNPHRYDVIGFKVMTAEPREHSRHDYTATERVTLDYEGRF